MVVVRWSTDLPACLGSEGRGPNIEVSPCVTASELTSGWVWSFALRKPAGIGIFILLAPNGDRPVCLLRDKALMTGGDTHVPDVVRVMTEGNLADERGCTTHEQAPRAKGSVGIDTHPAVGGRVDARPCDCGRGADVEKLPTASNLVEVALEHCAAGCRVAPAEQGAVSLQRDPRVTVAVDAADLRWHQSGARA